MPAMKHPIAIGREAGIANLKFLHALWSQARTAKAGAKCPPPFASRRFELASGPHELACWLPGAHPRGCTWWKEMSVWVLLRRVPVAREAPRRARA